MRHKYYDVIVAWAEGKEIQYKHKGYDWSSRTINNFPFDSPNFNMDGVEWRIKPEDKGQYRIAKMSMKADKQKPFYFATVTNKSDETYIKSRSDFVEWFTSWKNLGE